MRQDDLWVVLLLFFYGCFATLRATLTSIKEGEEDRKYKTFEQDEV